MPDDLKQGLAGFLAECARSAPRFRWVEPESLHLTLRFLGQVESERLEVICSAAAQVRRPPFQVALGGRRTFGSGRRARVVHLEVKEGAQELAGLAEQLEVVAVAAGLLPEERPYHPHLTLARARERGGLPLPEDLPQPPALARFEVTGFELYRSELRRAGAAYSVIRAFHMLTA